MSVEATRPPARSRAKSALIRAGRFVEHPYVTVSVGLVVIGAAGVELVRDVQEGLEAEHGVIALGLVHLFKGVSALAEALDKAEEVVERIAP